MFVFGGIKRDPSRAAEPASFPYFDWLRFGLASVVTLYHERLISWSQAGNFAVQVFFALSGWLIGSILLRSDQSNLYKFYFNRATRIWIPYVIAVAVLYSLSAIRETISLYYFKFLVFDLSFTHNYFIDVVPSVVEMMPLKGTGNHFWSISVEEQFYLAAPLLIVLVPFGRSIVFWTVLALAANLTRFWYGSISLGVLAAVIRWHYGDWQCTRPGFGAVIAAGLLITMALITLPPLYGWLAPPLALTIILASSWSGNRSPAGEFLGGVSYPLYLYHWIGGFTAKFLAQWVWLPSLTAYVLSVCVGIAAYLTIDRNVMRWRGSFYRPVLGRRLMVTAYALFAAGMIAGAAMG